MPFLRRFICSLLLLSPLAAQETLFNHVPDPKSKTRVEVTALFNRPAPSGFLPLRVTVHNHTDQNASLTLSCECADGSYGGQGSEMNSSFEITAPAGKASVHDLLVPCTTLLNYSYGGRQAVSVQLSGSFGGAFGNLQTSYADTQPAVLLSEALYTPNASALDAHLSSSPSSSRYYGADVFAGKFHPLSLPEDWRAYSGYDAVAMTDQDWGNAPPGARNAILRWNRLGGELAIYSQSPSTDLATLGIAPEGKGVREGDRSFGRVTILKIGSDLKLDPAPTVDRFQKNTKMPTVNSSIRGDFGSGWSLKQEFGEQRYNYTLFILILVGFGVLVGPVNLFVFAKSGRRHRLFITTPLIALGTSAVLVALIILIDGFGGRGMRAVLMEVRPDDGENSAYIYQEQISRTGVLLGGGFEVTEPATLTSVPLEPSQWSRLTQHNSGGGMRYEMKLADGKLEVEGDWFQSRSEQGHFIRAIVPTRGRIEARNTTGTPSFLSTFDFEIDTLFFQDASGGVWKAEHVTPGKAFTCAPASGAELASFAAEARSKLSPRSRRPLEIIKGSKPLYDRPDHFIAVTNSAPGVDTLKGIKWTNTRTYITGPIVKP